MNPIIPGTNFLLDLASTATGADAPTDFTATAATIVLDGPKGRTTLRWRPAGGGDAGFTADAGGLHLRLDGTWSAAAFTAAGLWVARIEVGLPPNQVEVGIATLSVSLPANGPIPTVP